MATPVSSARPFPWLPVGVALGSAGLAYVALSLLAARRAEAAGSASLSGALRGVAARSAPRAQGAPASQGAPREPVGGLDALFAPGASEAARETAALAAARQGLIPPHLLAFKPVRLTSPGHTGVVYVMPDHFGLGAAGDWLRVPLSGRSAERLARQMGWLLPTRKIVDAIWESPGTVRLAMTGRTPGEGETRNAMHLWLAANAADARAVGDRDGTIVAGHRKSYTVGRASLAEPGNDVIYDGRDAAGNRIQTVENNHSHALGYVDYSQVPRFIAPQMEVDGGWRDVADVAADPVLSALVSHNGPFTPYGYRV